MHVSGCFVLGEGFFLIRTGGTQIDMLRIQIAVLEIVQGIEVLSSRLVILSDH